MRRRACVRALSAGHTVTTDGCAIGVEPGTGRLAGLSWAEAERGVLVCGADAATLAALCQPAVAAAVRRRKAVVIVDVTGGSSQPWLAAELCQPLRVPVQTMAAPGAASLPPVLGRAIRRREVVLVSAAPSAAADLADVLTRLRDLRLRGDMLAWFHGFENADTAALGALLALGPATGTSLLFSTASDAAAAALAGAAGLTVAAAPLGHDLAVLLASQLPARADAVAPGQAAAAYELMAQPAGTFAVIGRNRPRQLTPRCVPVPIRTAGR